MNIPPPPPPPDDVAPYQAPFEELVGERPSLEMMKDVVVARKLRPTVPAHWSSHQVCNCDCPLQSLASSPGFLPVMTLDKQRKASYCVITNSGVYKCNTVCKIPQNRGCSNNGGFEYYGNTSLRLFGSSCVGSECDS